MGRNRSHLERALRGPRPHDPAGGATGPDRELVGEVPSQQIARLRLCAAPLPPGKAKAPAEAECGNFLWIECEKFEFYQIGR